MTVRPPWRIITCWAAVTAPSSCTGIFRADFEQQPSVALRKERHGRGIAAGQLDSGAQAPAERHFGQRNRHAALGAIVGRLHPTGADGLME
jgi:hypothetical protein